MDWKQTPSVLQLRPKLVHESPRIKSPQISTAYFSIQIQYSALCVGSLNLLFGLRRTNECQEVYRKVISIPLTTV